MTATVLPPTVIPQSLAQIACQHCGGIVLTQDLLGNWQSKHHGRRMVIHSYPCIVEVDCDRAHPNVLVIDAEKVVAR